MARTNPRNTVSSTHHDEVNANSNKVLMPVSDHGPNSPAVSYWGRFTLFNQFRLLENFNLLRCLSVIEVKFNRHTYRSVDELILVQRQPLHEENKIVMPVLPNQQAIQEQSMCNAITDHENTYPVGQEENDQVNRMNANSERKGTVLDKSAQSADLPLSFNSMIDDNRDWPYLTDECTCMLLRIPLHQRNKNGATYHSRYCPYNRNIRKNTERKLTVRTYLKSALRFICMITSTSILLAMLFYILVILCYLSEQDLYDGRDDVNVVLPSIVAIICDIIGYSGSAALASLFVCIGCLFLWIISGNDSNEDQQSTLSSHVKTFDRALDDEP
ncbi:hypothetical protein TrispH2_008591 [Trichoplax sp. H2]|nr:hypothetical protein TrispH2_008591 [Trichoplax sp. H2]|eukprot:RDD38757.1 hypothetical protein TrispH2_008591 [Trichoplax sp. H2]